MKVSRRKPCPPLALDEPIPFRITALGYRVLRAWRVTRSLRLRRARHWRN
jgi:hypothetical protein